MEVLDGYANFLRETELALPKHQPCLVRWVKDFLLFAKEHGGYTFVKTTVPVVYGIQIE